VVFGDGDLCVVPKRQLLAGQEAMERRRQVGSKLLDGWWWSPGRLGRGREAKTNQPPGAV
jgi:hypothetical protein